MVARVGYAGDVSTTPIGEVLFAAVNPNAASYVQANGQVLSSASGVSSLRRAELFSLGDPGTAINDNASNTTAGYKPVGIYNGELYLADGTRKLYKKSTATGVISLVIDLTTQHNAAASGWGFDLYNFHVTSNGVFFFTWHGVSGANEGYFYAYTTSPTGTWTFGSSPSFLGFGSTPYPGVNTGGKPANNVFWTGSRYVALTSDGILYATAYTTSASWTQSATVGIGGTWGLANPAVGPQIAGSTHWVQRLGTAIWTSTTDGQTWTTPSAAITNSGLISGYSGPVYNPTLGKWIGLSGTAIVESVGSDPTAASWTVAVSDYRGPNNNQNGVLLTLSGGNTILLSNDTMWLRTKAGWVQMWRTASGSYADWGSTTLWATEYGGYVNVFATSTVRPKLIGDSQAQLNVPNLGTPLGSALLPYMKVA